MKKTEKGSRKGEERILGRRLAREMTPEELEKANGAKGRPTWSLSEPPDTD